MADTALIGIDWGTTGFRAYRIDGGGAVLEDRVLEAGILTVQDGAFEAFLRTSAGDWLDEFPNVPVLLSGMITSRQGWVETPYLTCPAGIADLSSALTRHDLEDGRPIHFVTGLTNRHADGAHDVMRGEETQIVGVMGGPGASGHVVLPGTHSKWARIEDGRIAWFATFMTGEVFGALKTHTILGRMMNEDAGFDADCFARGFEDGRYEGAERGGLLRRLFAVRTHALFDELPSTGLPAYLSGLLIGTEIREAFGFGAAGSEVQPLTIIGNDRLSALYQAALAHDGVPNSRAPGNSAAAGLYRIAREGGFL